MSSKMESIIDEIEEYIAECKYQKFSQTNIIVDKEELEELLYELKTKTPDEIRRYQKIISNKEAILADAQAKADAIIAEATAETNELVSEHQIMQQAYAQANEIVMITTKQAQETLDKAAMDANNIRQSAMVYTDELLKSIESTLVHTIEVEKSRHEALLNNLQNTLDIVLENRRQLFPPEQPEVPAADDTAAAAQAPSGDTSSDNEISMI